MLTKFILATLFGATLGSVSVEPIPANDDATIESIDVDVDQTESDLACGPACVANCTARYDACRARAGRDADACFEALCNCTLAGSPPGAMAMC